MPRPELLLPAGNLEKLKMALLYGADACYIGAKEYSLRAQASNFTIKDISEAVKFAHDLKPDGGFFAILDFTELKGRK